MKQVFSVMLLLFSSIQTFSQIPSVEERIRSYALQMNTFSYQYPQEKVYLHLDNTGYFKGERIWYKAYVVMAENHRYSPMSKVLYVELLTPEGQLFDTQKQPIIGGGASGSFLLEDRLYAGYYQIRAYTRCMLNFGDDVVFSRVFPVFDMPREAGAYEQRRMSLRGREIGRNLRPQEKNKEMNVSFYPEGGNLVVGLNNRIAFKVTDKAGKFLQVKGSVLGNSGEIITNFESMHEGMGSFEVIPQSKPYRVDIKHEGKIYKFTLPAAQTEGYAMQVNQQGADSLRVKITKTENAPDQTLGLTFSCRGRVYSVKDLNFTYKDSYTLMLPTTTFPDGVLQTTLFTSAGEIISQRHSFINHQTDNNLNILPITIEKIQTEGEAYSPIDINFLIRDKEGKPIATNFSLSVRDAGSEIWTNYTDNIATHLLLSSELKGYIHNPAYYFEADDTQRRQALDLLLLVQAWVRYPWKRAARVEPFEAAHFIEKNLTVEGSVLSVVRKKPVPNVEVTMWMGSSRYRKSQRGKCTTDERGRFNFELAELYGTFKMNLTTKRRDKTYDTRILLNRNISPNPESYNYYETHPFEYVKSLSEKASTQVEDVSQQISQQPEKQVDRQKRNEPSIEIRELRVAGDQLNKRSEDVAMSFMLKEVEVQGEKTPRRALLERLLPFAEEHFEVIHEIDKLRDEGRAETGFVGDFLMEVSPYLSYTTTGVKGRDMNINFKTSVKYKGYPVVFTEDGRTVHVEDISTDEIEHVVVIRSDAGSSSTYTIHLILNENGVARKDRPGTRKTNFAGFTPPVEFYSPDYSIAALPEPDFRRTLYWNPDVKTDNQGHASVQFYNNGTSRELIISAEGLTSQGVPVVYQKNKNE